MKARVVKLRHKAAVKVQAAFRGFMVRSGCRREKKVVISPADLAAAPDHESSVGTPAVGARETEEGEVGFCASQSGVSEETPRRTE
jgi:hypothetical protein